jgi:hypothetical protein
MVSTTPKLTTTLRRDAGSGSPGRMARSDRAQRTHPATAANMPSSNSSEATPGLHHAGERQIERVERHAGGKQDKSGSQSGEQRSLVRDAEAVVRVLTRLVHPAGPPRR